MPLQTFNIGANIPFTSAEADPGFEQDTFIDILTKITSNFNAVGDEIITSIDGGLASSTYDDSGLLGGGGGGTGLVSGIAQYADVSTIGSSAFIEDADGWTVVNGTLTYDGTKKAIEIEATSANCTAQKTFSAAIEGARYTHVVLTIKKVAGTASDQKLFYSTGDHGFGDGYYTLPQGINTSLDNTETSLIFDMTDLISGGDDWIESTITGIRFKMDPGSDSHYYITNVIVVGKDAAALIRASETSYAAGILAQEQAAIATSALSDTEAAKTLAETYSLDSEASKIAAQSAQTAAQTAKTAAEAAQATAVSAKNAAESAATTSASYASQAQIFRDDASLKASDAASSVLRVTYENQGLLNPGFEFGTVGTYGAPKGWLYSTTSPNAFGFKSTVDATSSVGSKKSFGVSSNPSNGVSVSTLKLGKKFDVTQAQSENFTVNLKVLPQSAYSIPGSITLGTDQTYVALSDIFFEMIAYDSLNQPITLTASQKWSKTLSQKLYDAGTTGLINNTVWRTLTHTFAIPATAYYVTINACTTSNAGGVQNLGYISGSSLLLLDDFSTYCAKPISEFTVQSDAAITAASNAAIYANNSEQSSIASQTATTAAQTYANNAANSATSAAGSATSAATSSGAASTSATAASTAATNAASYRDSAQTYATAAGNSATNAATSATNASSFSTISQNSSLVAQAYSDLARYLDIETVSNSPFIANVNSWVPTNATLALIGTYAGATYTSTGSNPFITRNSLSFSGRRFDHVLVRVKRVSGTDDSQYRLFWKTAGHDYDNAYYSDPINTIGTLSNSVYTDLIFDMRSPTAGGTDWVNSTITGLRLDLAQVSSNVYEISYIYVVGQDASAPAQIATAAATSASNASASETAAGSYATTATTQANTATTAAGSASTSATAAASSASSAATQATNAATSATTAANHAATASNAATTATTQASAAANSASSAATQATNASTSAGAASTSASQASTSATNAAGSAVTATTQATNAATSASGAATSATAAATSATASANSASASQTSAIASQTYANNSASSATAAASSATSANSFAASASSAANLSARVSGGTGTNANPIFLDWTSADPASWTLDVPTSGSYTGGTATKETSDVIYGNNAVRLTTTAATQTAGLYATTNLSTVSIKNPLFFEVELSFKFVSGSTWDGMVLAFNYYNSSNALLTTSYVQVNGFVPDDTPVAGKRYTFKTFITAPQNVLGANLSTYTYMTFGAYANLGSYANTGTKVVIIDKFQVTPASETQILEYQRNRLASNLNKNSNFAYWGNKINGAAVQLPDGFSNWPDNTTSVSQISRVRNFNNGQYKNSVRFNCPGATNCGIWSNSYGSYNFSWGDTETGGRKLPKSVRDIIIDLDFTIASGTAVGSVVYLAIYNATPTLIGTVEFSLAELIGGPVETGKTYTISKPVSLAKAVGTADVTWVNPHFMANYDGWNGISGTAKDITLHRFGIRVADGASAITNNTSADSAVSGQHINPNFEKWTAAATSPDGWARLGAASGTLSKITNKDYPEYVDKAFAVRLQVNSGQNDGLYMSSSTSYRIDGTLRTPLIQNGYDNLNYYTVECEFTPLSGNITGIQAYMLKTYTGGAGGTASSPIVFSTVLGTTTPKLLKRQIIRKTIAVEAVADGIFTGLQLGFYMAPSGSNQDIILHRLQYRPATTEEVRTFNVASEISASVSVESAVRASVDNDIYAKYAVKLDVNGYVSGFGLISSSNTVQPNLLKKDHWVNNSIPTYTPTLGKDYYAVRMTAGQVSIGALLPQYTVKPNTSYTFTCKAKVTTGSAVSGIYFDLFPDTLPQSSTYTVGTSETSIVWQGFSSASADMNLANIQLRIIKDAGIPSGTVVEFTEMKLEESSTATPFSVFSVIADQFMVAKPGVNGALPQPVFDIGTVNGVTKVVIRGDVVADGSIVAEKITAGTITADRLVIGGIVTDRIALGAVVNYSNVSVSRTSLTNDKRLNGYGGAWYFAEYVQYDFAFNKKTTAPVFLTMQLANGTYGSAPVDSSFGSFRETGYGTLSVTNITTGEVLNTVSYENTGSLPQHIYTASKVAGNTRVQLNTFIMDSTTNIGIQTYRFKFSTGHTGGAGAGGFVLRSDDKIAENVTLNIAVVEYQR